MATSRPVGVVVHDDQGGRDGDRPGLLEHAHDRGAGGGAGRACGPGAGRLPSADGTVGRGRSRASPHPGGDHEQRDAQQELEDRHRRCARRPLAGAGGRQGIAPGEHEREREPPPEQEPDRVHAGPASSPGPARTRRSWRATGSPSGRGTRAGGSGPSLTPAALLVPTCSPTCPDRRALRRSSSTTVPAARRAASPLSGDARRGSRRPI